MLKTIKNKNLNARSKPNDFVKYKKSSQSKPIIYTLLIHNLTTEKVPILKTSNPKHTYHPPTFLNINKNA
jgi:hypothetical protein